MRGATPLRAVALPISLTLKLRRQTALSGLHLKRPLWIDRCLMDQGER